MKCDLNLDRLLKLSSKLTLAFVTFALCLTFAGVAHASDANSGGFWYTVRPGDTISGISAKYDVSVAGILRANKLRNARSIYVGQRLYLPPEADSPGRTSKAEQPSEEVAAPAAPASAKGKVIYVSLGKQRAWAYQNGNLDHVFVVSTGLPERATKPGTFRVQTKLPEAWSNVWQLHMPYWLGIYNVGRIENGFHALPINTRGVKLWAGLLGRPASFGCIILGDKDAKTLYDWAEIGTLVVIRR
jgi:LysM repeat protein